MKTRLAFLVLFFSGWHYTATAQSTGEITKVAFQMPDVAHTFKKGHRLMVQVQSSWFPLVDRNPQVFMSIPKAEKKDFKKAEIKLYHDAEHPSQLKVTVVKKQ